jgi:hypothetical protein
MLHFPYISRLQQLLVFVVHWMGITVLKDHTSWQMFMPLPANSLMQSAWHVTPHVHIHFWISKYGYNTDAMAFQHTSILYILCLSMKMEVSVVLKFILSKMVSPCLTHHHGFRGPVCSFNL